MLDRMVGEEIREREAQAIVSASDITEEEFDLMSQRMAEVMVGLTDEEKAQHRRYLLKKVYEVDGELSAEWVRKNNRGAHMKAIGNLRRLLRWQGDLSDYLEQRRRRQAAEIVNGTDSLHLRGDVEKEMVVNKLVHSLGWKSAVDMDTEVTREEIEQQVSALLWDKDFVQFVCNLFERKNRKRGCWTVKNTLEFVNPLLEAMYLVRVEAHGYTAGKARKYRLTVCYEPPT